MTDHVFALGTATTTPITLNDDEDVLAATADANDESSWRLKRYCHRRRRAAEL